MRFLEISVTVQLDGFTHEIINTLSVWELFPALLAVDLLLRLFFAICCIVILMELDKLKNCVTAPFMCKIPPTG